MTPHNWVREFKLRHAPRRRPGPGPRCRSLAASTLAFDSKRKAAAPPAWTESLCFPLSAPTAVLSAPCCSAWLTFICLQDSIQGLASPEIVLRSRPHPAPRCTQTKGPFTAPFLHRFLLRAQVLLIFPCSTQESPR